MGNVLPSGTLFDMIQRQDLFKDQGKGTHQGSVFPKTRQQDGENTWNDKKYGYFSKVLK